MTPFIRKELRSLAIPAGLVLAATLVGAWAASGLVLFPRQHSWDLFALAWFLGTPLVAASSFGTEFHHRTMTLLLTQPVPRGRVWMEKWFCLVGVVSVLAVAQVVSVLVAVQEPSLKAESLWTVVVPGFRLTAVMFAVMIVCSAPLWTLLARSTIGGFVATSVMVMYVEATIGFLGWLSSRVVYWVTGTISAHAVFGLATPVADGVRAAYSLLTLWLGWRVFARFQTVGTGFFDGQSTDLTAARWAVLRPRRGGAIGNIVRKELMLHRPTFLVAAAFVAVWLALRLVLLLRTAAMGPASAADAADVLTGLLLLAYMPFVIALTGIMPAGEDCSLGVRTWHLTLPVSTRSQWAIKLVVSLVVGFVLVLVLPALLTATVADAGAVFFHAAPGDFFKPFAVIVVTGGIVLGFWASALLGDTVKAAVGIAVVAFALALVVLLGGSVGDLVGRRAHWFAEIVTGLNAPRGLLLRATGLELAVPVFITTGIVALWQSLVAFRQVQMARPTAVRMSLTLLAVAFVTALVGAACATAAWQVHFNM